MRIANTTPRDVDALIWTVKLSGAEFASAHPQKVANVLLEMVGEETAATSKRLLALAALAMLFESSEKDREEFGLRQVGF